MKALITMAICLLLTKSYAQDNGARYNTDHDLPVKVVYADTANNQYLRDLREKYRLDEVVKDCKTQSEIALAICHWVHLQWKHNGGNTPEKSDAMSILEESKKGKLFRCVEYGITISGALNALGIKSRTLGLKMKGADTITSGAGHVVAEAYLSDLKKWVYLDGQFDVMPVLNGTPLNAVELQETLARNNSNLKFKSLAQGISKEEYIEWITPYLYFMDIETDNQEAYGLEKRRKRQGLMLVPIGEKCPIVFQKVNPMNYICSSSKFSFYLPAN